MTYKKITVSVAIGLIIGAVVIHYFSIMFGTLKNTVNTTANHEKRITNIENFLNQAIQNAQK